jgi:uncharacterized protein (UPF0248 family)
MTPIHELLHRIRWDPEFGHAEFKISYWDRVARRVVRVPLHRVRAVWRNGALIWQRPQPAVAS